MMTSMKSVFNLVLATTFFIGVALSQSDDNKSKAQGKLQHQQAEQAEQAEQAQPSQQQSASLLSKLQPESDISSLYIPYLNAGDDNDAILVPYDELLANEIGDSASNDEEDAALAESNEADKRFQNRFVGKRYQNRFVGKRYQNRFVGKRYQNRFVGKREEKRYTPRFVGKRYTPRFVGKRYTPRFVGKRYNPRFVGKRYTPRFVGKRYNPRFVGKRYNPRFVGKREAELINSAVVAHSIQKRQAPRFVGKRESVYEPLGAASWVLGESDSDYENSDDYYGEDDREGKDCSNDATAKRGAPRFVGKRGGVDKRENAPRFVGKRANPRFVGKRDNDDFNDYFLQLQLLKDIYNRRNSPAALRFKEKKSITENSSESEIQAFLDEWSRQEALQQLAASDKRWGQPVTPSFIGKRMMTHAGFKRR